MSVTTTSWTLRHGGSELRVDTWVAPEGKERNCARLLVDGAEIDTGAAEEIGHVDLGEDSDHPTRVAWWWTGRVARCDLVEPGAGHPRHRSTPYAPPSGTRAARWHAWGERHPRLYAARHVVLNLLGTVAAVLGVSALLGALLPRIDLGWLPDVDAPDWLAYLDPARYLAPLFAWVPPLLDRLLGWVPDWDLGWVKYVVGFLFAVSLAVREVRRRKRVSSPPTDDPTP